MVRVHPRYAVEIDAELVFDDYSIAVRSKNISIGGMCLLLDPKLELGTQCQLKLSLVFPDQKLSESLTVLGVVVWSTKMNEQHQIGFKFVDVPPDVQHFLDLFVKYLEEGDQEDDVAETEGDEE